MWVPPAVGDAESVPPRVKITVAVGIGTAPTDSWVRMLGP